MYENFDYYMSCKKRKRNQGLFTADQVFDLILGGITVLTFKTSSGHAWTAQDMTRHLKT